MELHSAIAKGQMSRIRSIVAFQESKGLAPELTLSVTNRFGWAPIHTAVYHEQPLVIQMLISYGVNVNHKANRTAWTFPLHLAALKGNVDILRQLLSAGADANLKDYHGHLPLRIAKGAGHRHCVAALQQYMALEAVDEEDVQFRADQSSDSMQTIQEFKDIPNYSEIYEKPSAYSIDRQT